MIWETLAAPVANVLLRALQRPVPKLGVSVKCTGGGSQIDFTAFVENSGTGHAAGCMLTAELEGVGLVFTSGPFGLPAGTFGHPIRFGLDRPRYGDLVHALNNEATIYGRRLTVRLKCGWRSATDFHDEPRYDPETDAARYAAQQEAWSRGSGGAASTPPAQPR